MVEGAAFTGKTLEMVKAATSPWFARTWWIGWGEGVPVDVYADLVDERVQVVQHDGTFLAVQSIVEQLHVQARELVSREATTLLVIDGAHGEWKALVDLGRRRTTASPEVARSIERNPLARFNRNPMHDTVWHELHTLHRQFMRVLKAWPGVVVIITRGRELIAYGEDGQWMAGERDYRLDGHRDLLHEVSAWVRFLPDGRRLVMAVRDGEHGPTSTDPREFAGLEHLVFDTMGYQPRPWEPELDDQAARQQLAGEPRPSPVDWTARLAGLDNVADPVERRAGCGELWSAIKFAIAWHGANAVPREVVTRVQEIGGQARHQVAESWSRAWDDAHEHYEVLRVAAERSEPHARTTEDRTEGDTAVVVTARPGHLGDEHGPRRPQPPRGEPT
ncbi:hypothetical protein [Umezawaea sp. Da 62-37]|uniref:hypothetical protein n=1 Tax=Umezawaea sp. Da 62-37 TaxID=3075927 RepID=UPI0028F6E5C3|nr:hypothetical protein [Umezawaea sp. Da 62-37]WNV83097.1 hypothetical protein RM788_33575 [Umezawaea sp. Da 62-37]